MADEEHSVVRESPRHNKGKNTRYAQDEVQQENVRPKLRSGSSPTTKKSVPRESSSFSTFDTESYPKGESSVMALERMQKELQPFIKSDKEMKKSQLVDILTTLRKQKWQAEHNAVVSVSKMDRTFEEHKKTKAALQEALDRLQDTNDKLKKVQEELLQVRKELAQSEKKRATALKKYNSKLQSVGKGNTKEENKAILEILKPKVDFILFALVKFIQDYEEEMQAAKLLVHYGDLPEELVKTSELKAEFAENYSGTIKKTLFHRRGYVTADYKKLYKKKWDANIPTLTVQDLVMCVQRNITTEEDMEKFMEYWEQILPIMAGKHLWHKETKYYTTITEATNKLCTTHEFALITPEHEAFAVLSIENHLQRWRTNHEKGVKDKDDSYNGIYTTTTSGQNQYGGWSAEGMEKYMEYLEMNMAARKDASKAHVEQQCLNQLRKKYNIQANSFVEHQRQITKRKNAAKRGRAEEPMPPMKKKVLTMRITLPSDDEDNDTDEDGE
jgi:hypothetical protein